MIQGSCPKKDGLVLCDGCPYTGSIHAVHATMKTSLIVHNLLRQVLDILNQQRAFFYRLSGKTPLRYDGKASCMSKQSVTL